MTEARNVYVAADELEAYSQPLLVSHGTVDELTRGTIGQNPDGGGAGSALPGPTPVP